MRELTKRLLLVSLALGLLQGCVLKVNAKGGFDIDRVMGGVDVAEDARVGDIDSVNGGVTLRANSVAGDVETVNGGVRLYERVVAQSVEAVNGGIRGRRDVRVVADIETVNGTIELQQGTSVGGDISTVNGRIELAGVDVGGDLETVNGDIELKRTSVKGDVIFGQTGRGSWGRKDHRPTLFVDVDSRIDGKIRLYQPVNLRIEDGARVGEIVRDF